MASSELKDGKTYRTREGRILESMIAVVDADADDDVAWHRAWVRWRKTMLECGWRPPATQRRPSQVTNQLPLWRNPGQRARHTS
jgi:hypothetical protein